MEKANSLPIRVVNPRRLGTWAIEAERTDHGLGYKPCLALLPSGELIMVSLLWQGSMAEKSYHEVMPLSRSVDGGRSWSEPQIVEGVIGREQWLTCTSRGTLFSSSTLLIMDTANTDGCHHSYLHRSVDGGRHWDRTKILLEGEERHGVPTSEWGGHTSRNVVELGDGTLLFGVSIQDSSYACFWRSSDNGESWDISDPVTIGTYRGKPYDNLDGFFGEDFTWLAASGKLLHWIRCGPPSPMFPMGDGRPTPSGDDGIDRTLMCESSDNGLTWSDLRDFGDYGMHYIRVIRLSDGRRLLTFTQRSIFYPIGLKAILSYDDGETWNFSSDLLIIEGSTPWGTDSGGGFGNTLQLPDGTLISCYSYRAQNDTFRMETVRWSLP